MEKPPYRKRLYRASVLEYKKFWSGYRLLVTLSGLTAPLLLQFQRGVHTMLSLFKAVESGILGLSISLIGTYLYSRRKGAESLDTGWQIEIARQEEISKQQTEQIAAGTEQVKRLGAEIDDLKKPKRNAFEEKTYQHYKTILARYGEYERGVLSTLKIHGKMIEKTAYRLHPLPVGLSPERAANVLVRLVEDQIVTRDHQQNIGDQILTWRISPGATDAVNDWL